MKTVFKDKQFQVKHKRLWNLGDRVVRSRESPAKARGDCCFKIRANENNILPWFLRKLGRKRVLRRWFQAPSRWSINGRLSNNHLFVPFCYS